DNAAGNLERRQRNAEQPEDRLASHSECRQDNEGGQRTLPRHPPSPGRVRALRDREKSWQRGEGVDQKEDRTQREQRKAHVNRVLQTVKANRLRNKGHGPLLHLPLRSTLYGIVLCHTSQPVQLGEVYT